MTFYVLRIVHFGKFATSPLKVNFCHKMSNFTKSQVLTINHYFIKKIKWHFYESFCCKIITLIEIKDKLKVAVLNSDCIVSGHFAIFTAKCLMEHKVAAA